VIRLQVLAVTALLLVPFTTNADSLNVQLSASSVVAGAENLSAEQSATILFPLEEWRSRALAYCDQGGTPEFGFTLLAGGAGLDVQGLDFAGDFLERQSDAGLIALFDYARASDPLDSGAPAARIRLSAELRSRASLSERHDEALYDAACMQLISVEGLEQAKEAVEAAMTSARTGTEYSNRIAALSASLTSPNSAADFEEADRLIDLAIRYGARPATNWVIDPTYAKVVELGPAGFEPSRWNGDAGPAVAATRVAFEAADRRFLAEMWELSNEWGGVDAESLSRLRYLIGMRAYADERLGLASERFRKAFEWGGSTYYAAASLVRLGQCQALAGETFDAAVSFQDAELTFPQYPELAQQASASLDFMIRSEQLSANEVQEAAAKQRQTRTTASATPGEKK